MSTTASVESARPRSNTTLPEGNYFLWPFISLAWRELIRFFRQKHRLMSALGTPVVFWLLIGAGLGASFRLPESWGSMSAMAYLFPGTLVLILLFTSIFSTISIIEDRREGFLQSVLVSPSSRSAVVLGKILGGTAVAVVQGLLFLALAPWVGVRYSVVSALLLLLLVFLISFGLTALGVNIAWRMQSTQGFHAVMNLFLIPLWMLSGAFFPASGAPRILRWVMEANPLTYAVASLRRGLYWSASVRLDDPSFGVSVIVITLFAAVLFGTAGRLVSRSTPGDLR